MAVLNKEDFFTRINGIIGTDTSDDAIGFIEDMTDTYNDMEHRAQSDGEDWEKRYHELDESWKKRYKSRFFSGGGGRSNLPGFDADADEDKETVNANITIDELFEKK